MKFKLLFILYMYSHNYEKEKKRKEQHTYLQMWIFDLLHDHDRTHQGFVSLGAIIKNIF